MRVRGWGVSPSEGKNAPALISFRCHGTAKRIVAEATTDYKGHRLRPYNRFAVDQARANGQLAEALAMYGKRPEKSFPWRVISRTAAAVAPCQNAEAVMLDFVQPAGAGRRCLGRRRKHGSLIPARGGYAHART
jgi:hypothetical protein